MTDWQSVLKSAGFPTTALVLDFETYFDTDYSLKKMSTVEYVCDDRFEITGLGCEYIDENNTLTFWSPYLVDSFLWSVQEYYGNNYEQITIIAQNAKFDCLILREHFGITPKYTVDTKDLSRHLDARNKHSLEAMAKRHGAPVQKGDTNQFKGLHWADINQEQRQVLEKYTKTDIEIETFLFKKLLPLITNPEIELPLANQTLQLYLNPQVEIDKKLGEELKAKMHIEMIKPIQQLNAKKWSCVFCSGDGKQEVANRHGWELKICPNCQGEGKISVPCNQKEISGNKSFIKLLEQHLGPDEQVPMKQGKNKMIPALAKDDRGMNYLKNEHKNPIVNQLADARIAIKSWPLHIKRIDNLINQANCRGDKIGMPLTYYAAHTGRWGGTEGINLQNLGGRGRGGQGTHPLIQQVRQMIKASDGYVFGVADFAQIEARVLAWLAGQDDLVQGFANGEDVYSEFATTLFGVPVRKAKKNDPKPIAKQLTIRRGFGKDAILGCGYGMGSNKFYERCYANSDLKPLFDSGEYDWDFINKLIKTYRRKYSKIPEFWQTVEKAWKFVTKYPQEVVDQLQQWYGSNPSKLKFYNQNGTTIIQLPSGRCLFYPHANVTRKGSLKYRWGTLWGGSIAENIVQAVARDIMGEALLRLQENKFNILFHVHDEIICLFPKFSAEKDLQRMADLMEIIPEWCKGLPLRIPEDDRKLSERYEK